MFYENNNIDISDEMFEELPLIANHDSNFDYELMIDTDLSDTDSTGLHLMRNETTMYDEISQISTDGLDLFLTKLYRYYLYRGYWNIVLSQITQLVIFTFFVLFCLFIFGAVDYKQLLSFRDPTKTYPFSLVVHLDWLKSMNAYFIISLIIFGIYVCWKIVRISYDMKVMWNIRNFYKNDLQLTDFQLSTTRWTLVIKRLNNFLQMKGYDELDSWNISARIMKKDNYLIAMIHHNIIKYDISIFPARCNSCIQGINNCVRPCIRTNHLSENPDQNPFKIKIFSRILLWSVTYCIINFIVNERNEIRNEILFSDRIHINDSLVNELKRKLRIIGFLNLLLIPFLALFVPIYTLFHYGEEFYKNPSSASNREWCFAAKWKFREYNELPHIFNTRMHICSKYAEQYIYQFPYGIFEHFAKLVTFIASSIIVFLAAICVMNETALINVELTPNKSLYWWIIVMSTIWVISRNMLKEQPIFFPDRKMEKLHQFLHYMPNVIKTRPNSIESLGWVKKYFQFKIVQLIQEIISIFINPFVLWFCIGSDAGIQCIINFARESTIEHSKLGKICEYSIFKMDSQYDKIIKSRTLEESDSMFNEKDKKVEQSIIYYNQISESDVEGIPQNINSSVDNTQLIQSQILINELNTFQDIEQK